MAALGLGDDRRLPVRRAARRPRDQGRHPAPGGAGRPRSGRRSRPRAPHQDRSAAGPDPRRPAPGAHGARGRPPRRGRRGARARRGAVDPGPAGAAHRERAGGRRSSTSGFADPESDFLSLPQPVALPARAAEGARLEPVPQDVQGRAPPPPPHPRVAGRAQPAPPGGAWDRPRGASAGRRARPRRHPPGAAGRPAVPRRDARPRRQRVPRRPGGALRARAGDGAGQAPSEVGHGGRARRDQPAAGPHGGPDHARPHRAGRRPPRRPQLRRTVVGRGERAPR